MSKIKDIAEKRKYITVVEDRIEAQQKKLERTQEYQHLKTAKERLTRLLYDLRSVETEYKDECVESHVETGMTNFPGGKVKLYTTLDYNKEQARNWAIEHNHAGLLNLAKREFERVAKSLNPDFVAISQTPKMTLSKDLSEFLESNETDNM